MVNKIVLAYSGGLDTSVALKWLQEKYNADVVTVTIDLGQHEDLKLTAQLAKSAGSVKHFSLNCLDEFAVDYIFPSIKSNGLYQGVYPLGTALARPLIARKLVEVAKKEGADTVAHGCTGKGNDQVRFDITLKYLNPNLKIVAPVREWNLSRDEEEKYAQKHKLSIKSRKSKYSIDQNLWGRAVEGGQVYDTENEPPPEALEWTTPLDKTPDTPGYVKIDFVGGVPVSVDGISMNPVSLIQHLNRVGGLHGIGLLDHVEDRVVGIKTREVYECPAAVALIEAHKDLEKLVLTRHELAFKVNVDTEWAWLIYSGLWVEPLRSDLQAFIDSTQNRVEGTVTLKMYKGGLRVVGRSSPFSLYNLDLATYDSWSTFDQKEAEGFINLWGLPSRQAGMLSQNSKKTLTTRLKAKPKKLAERTHGV